MGSDRRVVYTTGIGRVRTCASCGKPEGTCSCGRDAARQARQGFPDDGYVRLARDRKGRGGKTMTLVHGVPGDDATVAALAKQLKQFCGSGGTVRDGVIEIQGDHRDRLQPRLVALGYKVKIAGG